MRTCTPTLRCEVSDDYRRTFQRYSALTRARVAHTRAGRRPKVSAETFRRRDLLEVQRRAPEKRFGYSGVEEYNYVWRSGLRVAGDPVGVTDSEEFPSFSLDHS